MVVAASYDDWASHGEPLLGYLAATLYLVVLEYGMRAKRYLKYWTPVLPIQ
jgi:hypothetical protein